MKKISFLLVIAILVNAFCLAVFADEQYNFEKWKGVLYPESEIIEVNESSQFDISVTDISIDLYEDVNIIGLSGTINCKKAENSFETNGEVYISSSNIYNGDKLLIDLDETKDYKFLSFSIEANAREWMLLKPNEKLKGKTVATLVVLNKQTNDILFFEDEIESDDLFELVKNRSLNLNNGLDNEELQEKLTNLERWFLPYIEIETDCTEKSFCTEKSLNSTNGNDEVQLSIGSVTGGAGSVVNIPVSISGDLTGGIDNMLVYIEYDPNKVCATEISAGSIVKDTSNVFVYNINNTDGLISILYASSESNYIDSSGIFANLTFEINSSTEPGTYPLTITSNSSMADSFLIPISPIILNGEISVSSASIIKRLICIFLYHVLRSSLDYTKCLEF